MINVNKITRPIQKPELIVLIHHPELSELSEFLPVLRRFYLSFFIWSIVDSVCLESVCIYMYQTCLVKQQVQSKLDAFCCTTDHELKKTLEIEASWDQTDLLTVSFFKSVRRDLRPTTSLESESVEAMGATSVGFGCCFGVIQLVLSITTLALGVHLQDHCPADERIPYFMIGMQYL